MKKLIKFGICICIMLTSVYLIYYYYKNEEPNREKKLYVSNEETLEKIKSLQTEYNNNEIVMYIDIPDIFSMPIVQTANNEYYKNHNLYKEKLDIGTPYLDYRIKSLKDKKLIVYGYEKMNKSLPFTLLFNYQNKDFFYNHQDISVYTENGKKVYKVFSVFSESEDFSYRDLNGFIGNEYYEHLLNLKDKSIYDTNTILDEDSKIIIFESCSLASGCQDNNMYQVVVAKELNNSKDIKINENN